jgi:hypothetical protein
MTLTQMARRTRTARPIQTASPTRTAQEIHPRPKKSKPKPPVAMEADLDWHEEVPALLSCAFVLSIVISVLFLLFSASSA